MRWIDSHIHLDMYDDEERRRLLEQLPEDFALLSVSRHLESCLETLKLQRSHPDRVYAAYGFHPEQDIPPRATVDELFAWMEGNAGSMTAVGEVGLPYFNRKAAEKEGRAFDLSPYLELLDLFVAFAKRLQKPLSLHAVYEDADAVLDLLELHDYYAAHFHYFKGAPDTACRLIRSDCYISFTPELVYDAEQIHLARVFPLDRILLETDGPWPFEGPFSGLVTEPPMIAKTAQALADIRGLTLQEVRTAVRDNARRLYGI